MLFYSLAGGGGLPFLTMACFLLCASACLSLLKVWRSTGRSREAWQFGVVLTSLPGPAVLALGFSFVKPMLLARFLIICQPSLVLLAAAGLSGIRPKWLLEACLVVVGLLAAQAIVHYHRYPTKWELGRGGWSEASNYARLNVPFVSRILQLFVALTL